MTLGILHVSLALLLFRLVFQYGISNKWRIRDFWCQVLQRRISINASAVGRIKWQRVTLKMKKKHSSLLAFFFFLEQVRIYMKAYLF